ncbi:hypothetical protein Tco_0789225 [Tanacetum coccineum]
MSTPVTAEEKTKKKNDVKARGLEQIHEDDLEAMDLKWQLSLLSVRAKSISEDRGGGGKRCRVKGGPHIKKAIEDQFRIQDQHRKARNKRRHSKAKLAIDGVGLKDLDQLLESQIIDKSKEGLGYSVVPPPHPLIYNRPNKIDLSYSGLDEFKEPEFKGYGPVYTLHDDKGFVDSDASRQMTGNIAYLSDFKQFDRGYVAFRGGAYGCKISSKGTLKTANLDFEDVILLPDENRYFLNVPRKDMYSFDMKNIELIEAVRTMLADSKLPTTLFVLIAVLRAGLLAAGTITNESADASYFDSPSKDVGNDEQKSAADDQKQVEDGPDNQIDEKDKFKDDSSPKEVNAAGQHVNNVSPEVNNGCFKLNTVDPSVSTASTNDQESPKDMFKIGTSHTLEVTHVEFFSDEDEPEVDLGNILNSYTVPTTPNTRIHKDHPIKNVIRDVKSFVQTRRMTKPTSEQGFLNAVYE